MRIMRKLSYQKRILLFLITFIVILCIICELRYWRKESYQTFYMPYIPQHEAYLQSRFDSTAKFKIISFFVTANKWRDLSVDEGSVCVSTQVSFDHLEHVVELIETWTGAVSLAIFAPGDEFPLCVKYISYLRRCNQAFKNQVSVHMVFPSDLQPPYEEMLHEDDVECNEMTSKSYLAYLLKKLHYDWRYDYDYPQNMLRNVAREHCQTYWVTTPDVDMTFPHGAENMLSKFLLKNIVRNCSMCAFVIPIYEIHQTVIKLPTNKSELISMVKNGNARRYHAEVFEANQYLSRLTEWESVAQDKNEINILHKSGDYRFYYEPIYIARAGTPRFEERYLGYGMMRNTQVLEMHLSGYEFYVLDNIFLSHRGFQYKTVYNPKRYEQSMYNLDLFCKFHLPELLARYHQQSKPYDTHCSFLTWIT